MKYRSLFIVHIVFFLGCTFGYAQIHGNSFVSQYFYNRSLFNPAFIGAETDDLSFWVNYKTLNTVSDGRPQLSSFSVDYPSLYNASSIGGYVVNDKSGNFSNVKGMMSYSYLLPFRANKRLRLGMSLGYSKQRLIVQESNTNILDRLNQFNQRDGQMNATLGAVYVYNSLELSAGIPELFIIPNENIDKCIAYSSLGYRLESSAISLSSIAFYRYYKSAKQLFDIGVQGDVFKLLSVMAMFNTASKGITVGATYTHEEMVMLTFSYNVNNDVSLASFGSAFEVGARFYPGVLTNRMNNYYSEVAMAEEEDQDDVYSRKTRLEKKLEDLRVLNEKKEQEKAERLKQEEMDAERKELEAEKTLEEDAKKEENDALKAEEDAKKEEERLRLEEEKEAKAEEERIRLEAEAESKAEAEEEAKIKADEEAEAKRLAEEEAKADADAANATTEDE